MLRNKSTQKGFTLFEVTFSLGIISFCMFAMLGLLPMGLNNQQQARAAEALNMVSAAAHSVKAVTRDANGVSTFSFPFYFSDAADPASHPTLSTAGTTVFFLLEDGTIRQSGDNTPPAQTMFVQVLSSTTPADPLRIYVAVAWPYKPTDGKSMALSQLKGRTGFVDTFITYAPCQ